MKKLLIVGAGGFAKELSWQISDNNQQNIRTQLKIIGFTTHDYADDPNRVIHGFPLLGDDAWALAHAKLEVPFLCAIGIPQIRKKVTEKYLEAGFKIESFIHHSNQKSEWVEIGAGGMLMANSILTSDIKVGKSCLINLGATVGHDVVLGDYVSVHPGAHINGYVTIEDEVSIGAGAVINPKIRIGKGAIIGSGAVVAQDMPAGMVCVGVPAKPIKPVKY